MGKAECLHSVLLVVLATLLGLRPSWLVKCSCPSVGTAPSCPAPPSSINLLPATALPPAPLILVHRHRSSSTCSAGKIFPSFEAELSPPGQLNKAALKARLWSLCLLPFPFPQINRPPLKDTNASVSQVGMTVRMASPPASHQGLHMPPRAAGSPAPAQALADSAIVKGCIWAGLGLLPHASFSPGK